MSGVNPQPLQVVTVDTDLLNFTPPVFCIPEDTSLKAFQNPAIQNYSNTNVTATITFDSSAFVTDPAIIYAQPVTLNIVGSSSNNQSILIDGCYAFRSNALLKAINTIQVQSGNASVTVQTGPMANVLERYNNYLYDRWVCGFGGQYLDKSQNYEDLLGSVRNPLGSITNSADVIEPRGAYPHQIVTNTTTNATITATLYTLIPAAPLVDRLRRAGHSVVGIAHLNQMIITNNFYTNAVNRILSMAQTRPGGDVLTLSNLTLQIGQPTFAFVQLRPENPLPVIPDVVPYPVTEYEVYPYDLGALAPGSTIRYTINTFSLSRIPRTKYVAVRPSEAAYLNQLNGVFIPDCFAKLTNEICMYEGQTLFANASKQQLYQMCVANGLVDTYATWSGDQIPLSAVNGTYVEGSGSVIREDFGKDISLFAGRAVGMENPVAISDTFDITIPLSANPNITSWQLYLILGYSEVLELYGQNSANLNRIPLNRGDVINANRSPAGVNRVLLDEQSVLGGGEMGGAFISPRLASIWDKVKSGFNSTAGRFARNATKGVLRFAGGPVGNAIATGLDAVGFGQDCGNMRVTDVPPDSIYD